MLELEGEMRATCRDVMEVAIKDTRSSLASSGCKSTWQCAC